MMNGAFNFFRLWGIQVSVHWSWLVVALIQYQLGSFKQNYTNPLWGVFEYVTLFAIVLLHEFGHALACRSVGGKAEHIMLWPLGGIALVNPPRRPWPVLWSIAAGPLVNVVLLPLLWIAAIVVDQMPFANGTNLENYFFNIAWINTVLLIFNLLPIYPMDGGQIFQSILWFIFGQARSLLIAAVFGIICASALGLFAVYIREWFLVALTVFLAMQAWQGIRVSRILAIQEEQARLGQ